MRAGLVVYRTAKGMARFAWYADNGEAMFRVTFFDGGYLHTNSLSIAKNELKCQPVQLGLFEGLESQKEGKQ
jgi:hypothetical protein